ncbi:MAG: hypothetical protein K6F25_05940 [Bacteroidales bacterium]|nr:hypothetical protein [Bacteroidales bacterium]
MESRKHLAAEKKRCNSHNCAQSVVCTYCDLKMSTDGETWILNASPGDLARRFEESTASHSPLSILIGLDEALVTFSGDDHYLTIYNPDEELLELVRQCAQAEGLFVWGPKQP